MANPIKVWRAAAADIRARARRALLDRTAEWVWECLALVVKDVPDELED
ncbi:MAG: hypothetical protein ABI323_04650 [Solirubrobacteraceae bacterium]